MSSNPEETGRRQSLIPPWVTAEAVIDPISFHYASNIVAAEDTVFGRGSLWLSFVFIE